MCSKLSLSTKLVVSSILVIIIISALTAFAYASSTTEITNTLRNGLESTAGVMATQINASELQGIKPGDEMSPQYTAIVKKLRNMRSMDDKIVNAYIMHVNPDRSITFVADDLYPDDPQGSAKIGESYTTPDSLAIFAALSGPTSSQVPYTDKYGSFISAYAPIDDSATSSSGNTTAILGIDVTAKDYTDYMHGKGYAILLTGFVSILLSVGAIACLGMRLRKAE